MSWSVLRRPTAATLVFGLLTLTSSGLLHAGAASALTGRVLSQNGADPRPGVVVALYEPATERAFRSSPTDSKGGFSIDTAPPGSYSLLVETPEGAFLASDNLQLAPGVNRPVSLALKPGRAGAAPADNAPDGSKKVGVPTWAKWVITGGIIVGAAVVIDAVTKSNKEASTF